MKIEALPTRVAYKNNPLADVVCQIRFENCKNFDAEEMAEMQLQFSAIGYSQIEEEVSFKFVHHLGPVFAGTNAPIAFPQIRITHYGSEDNIWRVSVCSEYIALTCVKYLSWSEFLPKLQAAASIFFSRNSTAKPLRLGLRYKDVIEREPLGLEGVNWHELIKPFLLGPLAPSALAENQTPKDDDISSFISQTLLRLDDGMVLLQSSLLTAIGGERKAFLIDADFFNDGDEVVGIVEDPELMTAKLQRLHANAGALFYRGITERLHHALCPIT